MIVKALLVGALALAFDPLPQNLSTTVSFVANPYIEKISCDEGSGTGFKLSTGQWVSAHHVTKLTNCKIDGIPIVVTQYDYVKDYSIFAIPGDNRQGGIKADCFGYRDRTWYHGQGHARGLKIITSVPVMFSRFMQANHPRGWATLIYNRFIGGQSGGAVMNNRGEATGIVNAYAVFFPGSFSIALKDTTICSVAR